MNKDWVSIAMIVALAIVAIVALLAAITLGENSQDKTGAIAVATAAVTALGVLAGYLFKRMDGD